MPRAYSVEYLEQKLTSYAGGSVLIAGDVMLDEYLIGDTNRISPEAPIPVVLVEKTRTLVGGAGNVARNIKDLGGQACLLSVCGTDFYAEKLQEVLAREELQAKLIQLPGRVTTTKTRVIARQQQMLRIDQEEVSPVCGEALQATQKALREQLDKCKALVISDYGKGLITPDFMENIRAICKERPELPVLVDPKLPNFDLYSGVTLLTPNAKETSEGARRVIRNLQDLLSAGRDILQNLGCRHLLTTLGAQGMVLFVNQDEAWHIPTVARQVFDVTGAGDTVIATVALGLAAGLELLDACILANYAAGIVVAEVGAATATPAKMRQALHSLPLPEIVRLV